MALVPPTDGNAVFAEASILTGEHGFVVDAQSAHTLVVAAANNAGEYSFYLVETDQSGVEMELQPRQDITRQVCRVKFSQAIAQPMPGSVESSWNWIRDRACCFLAAENVGGMRTVLSETVDYANERVAFGRPIGTYQAIKHPLADMLADVESSSTAVLYAAWALAGEEPRASLFSSLAKSFSGDAYVAATHKSIQIFGAIGFTWEMKNHLFFKRARANAEMFGNSRTRREQVINLATDQQWSTPFALQPASSAA